MHRSTMIRFVKRTEKDIANRQGNPLVFHRPAIGWKVRVARYPLRHDHLCFQDIVVRLPTPKSADLGIRCPVGKHIPPHPSFYSVAKGDGLSRWIAFPHDGAFHFPSNVKDGCHKCRNPFIAFVKAPAPFHAYRLTASNASCTSSLSSRNVSASSGTSGLHAMRYALTEWFGFPATGIWTVSRA